MNSTKNVSMIVSLCLPPNTYPVIETFDDYCYVFMIDRLN
jgi:hypothetical protein